jgi:hypothetical protein
MIRAELRLWMPNGTSTQLWNQETSNAVSCTLACFSNCATDSDREMSLYVRKRHAHARTPVIELSNTNNVMPANIRGVKLDMGYGGLTGPQVYYLIPNCRNVPV